MSIPRNNMLWRIEKCCCALASLFPKVLSNGLYLWAIYAFCYDLCLQEIGGIIGLILSVIGFYLAIQGIYLYYRVIKLGAGSPLDFNELHIESEFNILQDQIDQTPPDFLIKNSLMIKSNGKFRYCDKCQVWKPDRCHHCSSCNKCWLKMDHHCPWFATCIGFKNQKSFVQFLVNTVIFGWYALLISGFKLYQFFYNENYKEEYLSFNIVILAVLGLTIGIAVGLFTAITIYFVSQNLTTIEYYDYTRYRNNLEIANDSYYQYSKKPSAKDLGNAYNLGSITKNFQTVLGETWSEWLLPIDNKSTGEIFYDKGLIYPANPKIKDALVSNSKLQHQLLRELQHSSYNHSPVDTDRLV
ncbi:Palmitoyltransferase PFA3 [Wickerhamomyces ciferrii]|uniref:Palmitoyltransferase n=1 Tax=Wickerhamomyces ciferrii (strain ATCC 14091 / BCRC 22168 / CBS 111 / JCM 3599 / NBRC 0793 / NRRL Y-1031 F-60-10) TaxID=1206466 RepID=K0KDX1_WICCF|nr:Palmitoyltransferase PFA3 [Wickerhamomyces ciferrii]CCH43275.1 Palmitoyltransferase PFA3 [Wickerhamomyces ciferrii]